MIHSFCRQSKTLTKDSRMNDILVSAVFPSRGRPSLLQLSVDSLRNNATKPERLEILVGLDPDQVVPSIEGVTFYIAPYRYGYQHINWYYNELSARAKGIWTFLWNDDVVMKTRGWDDIVASHRPVEVLWPMVPENNTENVFPITPTSWIDLIGHMSLDQSTDWWLQEMAMRLERNVRVPIDLSHLRVWDHTAIERNRIANPETYHDSAMKRARDVDFKKLQAFINYTSPEGCCDFRPDTF